MMLKDLTKDLCLFVGDIVRGLLRVKRNNLILFKPSQENSNQTIRDRINQHRCDRRLPKHIKNDGGLIVSIKISPLPLNPLNRTYFCLIEPANNKGGPFGNNQVFQYPRSGHMLQKQQSYWLSYDDGTAWPKVDGIAYFRKSLGF